VLGYLADDAAETISVEVSFDPPTSLYAEAPTMLVVLDGEPVKVAVEGADGLSIVINTNWDLFRSEDAAAYFLLLGDSWLSAATLDGPWELAQAPAGLNALPDVERFERVRTAIPGADMPSAEIPRIAVAQAPAELIVTDGPAELEPVSGAPLSFVTNTSSDIVFNDADAMYYVLMSGRWFKAASLEGPWTGTRAPGEFRSIPPGHPRGHVRASVAGTPEATLTGAEAQLPGAPPVGQTDQRPGAQDLERGAHARTSRTRSPMAKGDGVGPSASRSGSSVQPTIHQPVGMVSVVISACGPAMMIEPVGTPSLGAVLRGSWIAGGVPAR